MGRAFELFIHQPTKKLLVFEENSESQVIQLDDTTTHVEVCVKLSKVASTQAYEYTDQILILVLALTKLDGDLYLSRVSDTGLMQEVSLGVGPARNQYPWIRYDITAVNAVPITTVVRSI
jgi:hypothetical protein